MIAIIISIVLTLGCLALSIYVLYLKAEKAVFDLTVLRRSYPCKLIMFTQFGQPREETLIDFSAYEKERVIGITLNLRQEAEDGADRLLQSCPMVNENAIVY